MTKNQVTSFCIDKKSQKARDGFTSRQKAPSPVLVSCGTRADRRYCRAQTSSLNQDGTRHFFRTLQMSH
ncbi:MAG: hypothetical protein H6797_02790 [Candidatus Nomurabacteria bacterium]|nr:MAG: hypothetical protein H6797_02790 [Candidatus Nomurabacteria bacterium]